MKTYLDWSAYKESGMGDAYADIPKQGGDFAKAVAVCISSRQCETKGKGVMCPSYRVSDNPQFSTGGRVRLLKALLEVSCCGMGGSSGLESEHTEMAMAMAEDSLLQVSRANADSPLIANGFSCREQIAEGSERIISMIK